MAKKASEYAKSELNKLENMLGFYTEYGYSDCLKPVVEIIDEARTKMKAAYVNMAQLELIEEAKEL